MEGGDPTTPLVGGGVLHQGCPACIMEVRKKTLKTPPYRDLFLIALLVLCNVLPVSSLFPFLYFMVRDFHIASLVDIGYYAGLIGSSFVIGRGLTSVLWGIVSDKYGRKPVMLFGVFSIIVFNTLFGISNNLWMAVSTRFLLGVFNGSLGPIKAYASEICRDEHQALGISVIGTMWGTGLIIGPAIGGYLAQPAKKFPKLFSKDSLFARFPYFLPCLCISTMAVIMFITTFWLPETLHNHPLEVRTTGSSYIEKRIERDSVQGEDSNIVIQELPKKSLLKNWPVMSSILIYCVFSLFDVSYTELFSLWAESPKAYGGLSYNTDDVGTILAITGFGILLFQLLFYPTLERLVGAILLTRLAAVLTVPVLLSYPYIAKLSGSLQWAMVNCASFITSGLSVSMFTSMFIFLNNSVSQDQRGAANGLSMTAQSLFKAVGPAGGGSIFAWAQKRQDVPFLPGDHLVFFLLSLIILSVFVMTFDPILPRSLSRPQHLNRKLNTKSLPEEEA